MSKKKKWSLDDYIYEAQSKEECVTIDCVFGNPDKGEDEDEQMGWEIMCGDFKTMGHKFSIVTLFKAISYARTAGVPLYLRSEFLEDLKGPNYVAAKLDGDSPLIMHEEV